MKKRLALVLSIVLALSVAICLLVLPTSADPAEGYFDAEAEANTIWASAKDKVYTVYYNGMPMHNTKEETSLADLGIGFTGGTYTLDNGVLTLNNAEVADRSLSITAKGSLKVVINGKDLYASVDNSYSPYRTENDYYNPCGDLLITSETGNKIITGTRLDAIRSSGNLVIYGNVGFEVVHENGDDQIVIDDYGPSASVRMILAPEVDSIISGYGSRNIRHSRTGDVYLGGSANVTLANGYAQNFVTGGGNVHFLGTGNWTVTSVSYTQLTTVGGSNSMSAYENVTVSIDTGTAAAFHPSYTPTFHAYGNSDVSIVTQNNVLGGNTTIIDGNAKVSLTGTTSVTYGGTLTIGGSSNVTLETTDASGAGAIYDAKTTISGDANVTIIGAGNAVRDNKHNDTGGLVLSDNVKLTVNAGVYAFNETPVTASGNVQINVTAQDRAFSGSPLTLSDNVQVTASANGTYVFASSSLTATGNVKVDVTAATVAFYESAVSLSGTSTLDIAASGMIFQNGNVSLGGDSKTTAKTTGIPTYGSSQYTFDVFENAKLSIETPGGDVLYAYIATFKDNAQVSLKAGNGSVCWNSSLDILGNAIVDMHTDGTSGSAVNAVSTPISVSGNGVLNLTGTAANGIYLHYSALTVADNGSINMEVNATNAIYLQDYSPINMSGGSLSIRGAITDNYGAFIKQTSTSGSPISITGGTVDMVASNAHAFFETTAANTYVTIGKNATVSGIAEVVFRATGDGDSYLTFEALDSGSASNIYLITTEGTHDTGKDKISGHAQYNLEASVPRLFVNSTATAPSADVAVTVTDANGATNLSGSATSYSTEYGTITYYPQASTIYVKDVNIAALDIFVDCHVVLAGTNNVVSGGLSASQNLSVTGFAPISMGAFHVEKALTIDGAEVSVDGSGEVFWVRQSLTIKNGAKVSSHTTDAYALYAQGAILVDASEVTATADAGNGSAFRKYVGTAGDFVIQNGSVVTATAPNRYALAVDDGDLYITDSTVVATSAAANRAISAGFEFSSNVSRNIYIKNSDVTATADNNTIYATGNISIEGSDVTATGTASNAIVTNSNADGTVLGGTLTIEDSTVTATAPTEGVNIVGDVSILDSIVTANVSGNFGITSDGNMTIEDSEVTSTGTWDVIAAGNGTLTITGENTVVTAKDTPYYAVRAKNVVVKDGAKVYATASASECFRAEESIQILDGAYVEATGGTHSVIHAAGGGITIDSATVKAEGQYNVLNSAAEISISNSTVTATGTRDEDATTINAATTLSITDGSNVTASATNGGYAVHAEGLVTVEGSTLTATAARGNTIRAKAGLEISNGSEVTANSDAGATYNVSGNTTVTDSVINANNTNSGNLASFSGNLVLDNSDFNVDNTAAGEGISVSGNAEIINDSKLQITKHNGNYAFYSYGSITVDNSVVTINAAGDSAFRKYYTGAGDFIIRNGSYVEAIAGGRYALVVDAGDLYITNSTVTATAATYGAISAGYENGGDTQRNVYIKNSNVTASAESVDAGRVSALFATGNISVLYSDVTVTGSYLTVNAEAGPVPIKNSTVSVTGTYEVLKPAYIQGSTVTVTATGANEGGTALALTADALSITDGSDVTATATNGDYAVHANGLVTVEDSTLTATAAKGNAIRAKAGLEISNGSEVTANSDAGATYNVSGNTTVTDSVINANNTNSGNLANFGGNLVLDNSDFNVDNTAAGEGISVSGNVEIVNDSKLQITKHNGNYAFYSYGSITVDNSVVTINAAGGSAFRKYYTGAGDFIIRNGSIVDVSTDTQFALAVDNGNLIISDSRVTAKATVSHAITAGIDNADGSKNITIENSIVDSQTDTYYAIRATGDISISDSSDVYAKTGTSLTVTTASGSISIDASKVEIDCATTKGLATEGAYPISITGGSFVDVVSGGANAINSQGALSIENSTVVASGSGDVFGVMGAIEIRNNSNVSVTAEGAYPLYNYADFTIESSTVTAISNTAHRGISMFNNGTLSIIDSDVTAEVATSHAIMADTGNIVIERSRITAKALGNQDALAVPEGKLTVEDSSLDLDAGSHFAIHANNVEISGSRVDADTGASESINVSQSITISDSIFDATSGTYNVLNSPSVTLNHSDVTLTANYVIAADQQAVKIPDGGSLNVDGGTVRVNANFVANGAEDSINYYAAGIVVTNGTLNVTAGDLIVETTGNGAVGTSILLNYSTLNVGGGTSKAGLAVYNKGSYSGYAGGSAGAITMYPGTMNVMNNGSVYVYHECDRGIYMLTRADMADSWKTDAGLRVSGGQVEVYSAGSYKIPFGQGQGTGGADKTAFSANYKYTGGVVLVHTSYPGYVYDTTFLNEAEVSNDFFVGCVGRTIGDTRITKIMGEHTSFDRAGDLPSNDWIYWANDAEYQYYNPLNQGAGVLVSYDGEAKWSFMAPMMTSEETPYGQYFINEDVYELKKGQTVALTNNPVIRLTSGQAAYASFDVQWAAMTFVYESGAWIPSTHTYLNGGWVHKTGDEVTDATVKVTNRGTTTIETALTYTSNSGYENFAVSIGKSGEEEITVGGEIVYTVTLNADKPDAEMDSVAVGTLKLTVVMPGGAPIDETPVTPVVPNEPTAPGTPADPATPNIPSIPADPDEPEESEVKSFDSSISHAFFATANNYSSNGAGIYLFNVTSSGGVELGNWSWTTSDYGSTDSTVFRGLTAAKLRVHPTYGNVVIATSVDGWVGIIKYGTEGSYTDKQVLFEATGVGGAHDAEILPNGDFVVLSTASKLYYFNFSTSTSQSPIYTLTLKNVSSENSDGHGVMWDPTLDCLWVLHDYYIAKIIVENYGTSNVTLRYDRELHFIALGDDGQYHYVESSAHSFCPAYGEPGKYYFSGHSNTWIFDSKTMTFEKAADAYQCGDEGEDCGTASTTEGKLKGFAYFADGTSVSVPMGYNSDSLLVDWDAGGLHVTTWNDGVATHNKVPMSGYEFYKVFPVNADYQ